jgi:hypothetical protein
MASIQMMPAGGTNPATVNGRVYTCPLNGVLVVPDFDAAVLESNGWVRCASHGTGATTSRPTTGLFKGFEFFDSTLGINIIWDSKVWRSHATGAVV